MGKIPQDTISENHKILFSDHALDALARDFIAVQTEKGLQASTLDKYRQTFNAFHEVRLKDFDRRDFIAFACGLVADKKWGNNTLINRLRQLCAFNGWLFYQSLVLRRHRAPHYDKRPKRRDLPTADEWETLFDFLRGRYENSSLGRRWGRWRDYLVARILYETGMRIGECANLRVGDLEIHGVGLYALYINKGKTDAAERVVPISELLCDEIRAFNWTHRNTNKKAAMFAQRTQGHLDEGEFTRQIKKFAAELGIEAKVTAHVFRHNFILEYIKSGQSLIRLLDIIGHADVQMVRYYYNQTRRLFPFADLHKDFLLIEQRNKQRIKIFGGRNYEER